jgi:hypothetical protein
VALTGLQLFYAMLVCLLANICDLHMRLCDHENFISRKGHMTTLIIGDLWPEGSRSLLEIDNIYLKEYIKYELWCDVRRRPVFLHYNNVVSASVINIPHQEILSPRGEKKIT